MARILYTAENLGIPFRHLRELTMVVSPDGNRVTNHGLKMVLVLGGSCLHRFGKSRPTLLKTGDVLVVTQGPHQVYELAPQQDSARLHALVIMLDNLCLVEENSPGLLPDAQREVIRFITSHFSKSVHLKNAVDASLFEMVAQIRHEAALALPGWRWRIASLCAGGIVQLGRKVKESTVPATSQFSADQRGVFLVSCAKEFLLRHLSQAVSLSDVATHLHVSNGHLAHTFKRVMGQTLFTYFRQLRLEQSKLHLLNSEKNINQIAAACGFSSSTLFCRNFKSYTGKTPSEYRDELGANMEI